MGIGTSFGGWRIIKTVGAKITRLTSWQGFAATMAASTTIYAWLATFPACAVLAFAAAAIANRLWA